MNVPLEFEWDEAKRIGNIEKHGLDFNDADLLFGGPFIQAPAKAVRGEARWLAIGLIYDITATAIFTRRGSAVRLISLRRARRGEREDYDARFSRRA